MLLKKTTAGIWLTHFGLLITITGFSLSAICAKEFFIYGVCGDEKNVAGAHISVKIDDFQTKLRPDATVEQYISTLTVTDSNGKTIRGETSVNHPLKAGHFKLYQNSTGYSALAIIEKNGHIIQQQRLCKGEFIHVKDDERLAVTLSNYYPDFFKDPNGKPMTKSPFNKNPAYLYMLYYNGKLLGMNALKGTDKITVAPYTIYFKDPLPFTLIQIKSDPYGVIALIGSLIILTGLFLSLYLFPRKNRQPGHKHNA